MSVLSATLVFVHKFYLGCVVNRIVEVNMISARTAGAVRVAGTSVPAGYPSPAQDYFDGTLDLNEHLIKDKTSTFIVRVSGDSMEGAGISSGDELIVDRAAEPAILARTGSFRLCRSPKRRFAGPISPVSQNRSGIISAGRPASSGRCRAIC